MFFCRLLFVSVLNETVASHRFRVIKLAPLLQSTGIDVEILHFHPKLEVLAAPRLAIRLLSNPRVCTIVVFQKTFAFTLARLSRSLGAKVMMDYDDGSMQRIDGSWYPASVERRNKSWFNLMDGVVVSCENMREWILPWVQPQRGKGKKVHIIPTCVDVEAYESLWPKKDARCVIGWIGSGSPQVFLAPIEQALKVMTQQHNCDVLVVGGNNPELIPEIHTEFLAWNSDLEPQVFSQFDIGIMPLPNNERARMKAGFKLLQYMAAGLPVVASPIGVNRDIIRHGWNGFLADTIEEWISCLKQLACDPELRFRMGQNGRDFVKENYRLEIAASLWQSVCEEQHSLIHKLRTL